MKKGFTLAELLGVMVVLALISIVTVPLVTNSLNKYKSKLCSAQIDEIISAAKAWTGENMFSLPSEDGEFIKVDLKTLASAGFIDEKVNNPVTNEEFDPNTTIITIKKVGKKFTYIMDDKTVNTCYSNRKEKDNKKNSNVVYSRVNGATHVGYPIDANKDMGDKYVVIEDNIKLPFNSLEECNQVLSLMGSAKNVTCQLQNFKTPDLDYKESPDASWENYLKYTLNSNGIIEDIEVCGKHNNQEFCLKRSTSSSIFNQNKEILLNTFGTNNCDVESSYVGCGDDSVAAEVINGEHVVVGVEDNGSCYVFGSEAAGCIVLSSSSITSIK